MTVNLENFPVEDVLAFGAASTKYYLSTIMPDRFHAPFSKQHDEIFKLLDDPTKQRVAIAAPRGYGKTSTVTVGFASRSILYKTANFIVPISATADKAIMDGENLKRELEANDYIKAVFGSFKSREYSMKRWVTSNGVTVMPRGSGQQIRGSIEGYYRPDLILCDDLEEKEKVRSDEQRLKLKEWFFSDVCNSIDRHRKDWRIVVIGTILHEDSLLQNLLDDPEWESVRLEICDDDYHSKWPEFMTDEDVKKLAKSLRAQGLLDEFYREYRNMAVSTEDAVFSPEYFKYFEMPDLEKKRNIVYVILVDPAKTVKLHSAESAVVGVGIDLESARIYVCDISADRFYPDQLYEQIFLMRAKLRAQVIGVEVTSLNEFITQPLRNEIVKRRVPCELLELQARGQKESRVAALAPYYRQGYIHHNSNVCGPLEAQLMSFPRSARWDVMDAFAYIIEVLDKGSMFFEPQDVDGFDIPPETHLEPLEEWRTFH